MKIIIALALAAHFGFSNELVSLKDYLKKELAGSSKMSKESFSLSELEKQSLKKTAENADESAFTFYYGKTAEGKMEKACTIVGQKGKEGPLSVGVCFNPEGVIQSVTVLAHQEERGKRISEDSFLKQFKGKKMTDAFVVGKDVDGISGATWSSNYMSEALRKTSFAFKLIKI